VPHFPVLLKASPNAFPLSWTDAVFNSQLNRVDWMFTFARAAYNMMRIRNLTAQTV
jgi:hypothetical protein